VVPVQPRRTGLFVAAAVVLLGALGVGIYWNIGTPETPVPPPKQETQGPGTPEVVQNPPDNPVVNPPQPPIADPPVTNPDGGRRGQTGPPEPTKTDPPPSRLTPGTPPVTPETPIATAPVVNPPAPEPPPVPVLRGPPSNPAHRSTWTAPEDDRVMIWMAPGTFTQGSPLTDPDRGAAEIQQRTAEIKSGFWLDAYEVTNEAFVKFVRAQPEWLRSSTDPSRRNGDYLRHWTGDTAYAAGAANLPVSNVSWHAARAYCSWANKRLPTEAEWEFAARTAFRTPYWWGAEFDPSKANNGATLWPVDRPDSRNLWGFYNMLGNVMEWTEEGWLRGGALNRRSSSLRLASRVSVRDRAFANVDYGFRCAR
jgi:hypothetical protein